MSNEPEAPRPEETDSEDAVQELTEDELEQIAGGSKIEY